jgi:hypothetical protein
LSENSRRADDKLTVAILAWAEAVADLDFEAADRWLAVLSGFLEGVVDA